MASALRYAPREWALAAKDEMLIHVPKGLSGVSIWTRSPCCRASAGQSKDNISQPVSFLKRPRVP